MSGRGGRLATMGSAFAGTLAAAAARVAPTDSIDHDEQAASAGGAPDADQARATPEGAREVNAVIELFEVSIVHDLDLLNWLVDDEVRVGRVRTRAEHEQS